MEKENFIIEDRRNELNELEMPALKNYFKDKGLDNPTGYWKMAKAQMIEAIIEFELKDNSEDVKSNETEEKPDEKPEQDNINNEPETKKPRSSRSSKYLFKAINPDGKVMFESKKLADVANYSMENGIASAGWVNLSIRRNIPVLIGLGADQEIPEDFVPRTTKKYSGNYWKFTKELIDKEEESKEEESEPTEA